MVQLENNLKLDLVDLEAYKFSPQVFENQLKNMFSEDSSSQNQLESEEMGILRLKDRLKKSIRCFESKSSNDESFDSDSDTLTISLSDYDCFGLDCLVKKTIESNEALDLYESIDRQVLTVTENKDSISQSSDVASSNKNTNTSQNMTPFMRNIQEFTTKKGFKRPSTGGTKQKTKRACNWNAYLSSSSSTESIPKSVSSSSLTDSNLHILNDPHFASPSMISQYYGKKFTRVKCDDNNNNTINNKNESLVSNENDEVYCKMKKSDRTSYTSSSFRVLANITNYNFSKPSILDRPFDGYLMEPDFYMNHPPPNFFPNLPLPWSAFKNFDKTDCRKDSNKTNTNRDNFSYNDSWG